MNIEKPKNNIREQLKAAAMAGVIAINSGPANAEVTHYDEKGMPVGEKSQVESATSKSQNFKGEIDFDNFTATPERMDDILDLELRLPENIPESEVGSIMSNDIESMIDKRDEAMKRAENEEEKIKIEKEVDEKIRQYVLYAASKHFIPSYIKKNPFNESHKMDVMEIKIGEKTSMIKIDYNNSYEHNSERPNETAIGLKYDVLKMGGFKAGAIGGVIPEKQVDQDGTKMFIPMAAATIEYTANIARGVDISFHGSYTPSVEVGEKTTPEITALGLNFNANF